MNNNGRPILSASAYPAYAMEESDLQTIQMQQQNGPLPIPSKRFRFPRLALAAIGGFFHGLITSPLKGYELAEQHPRKDSNFSALLTSPYYFFKALITSPYYFVKGLVLHIIESVNAWMDAESDRIHMLDHRDQFQAGLFQSSYGFVNYLKGFFGLVLGTVRAFFDAFDAVMRPYNEDLLTTLIMAIPRYIDNFFSIIIESVEDWADPNSYPVILSNHDHIVPESTHKELQHLNDYLRVSVAALAGFFYGLLETPFWALKHMFNPPQGENFFISLLKAPLRFLSGLVTTPWELAHVWVEQERDLLDAEKTTYAPRAQHAHYALSGFDYLRVLTAAVLGFVYSFLTAPINAVSAILDKPTNENLLTKLILAPFRFVQHLVGNILFETGTWIQAERTQIDNKYEADQEDADEDISADLDHLNVNNRVEVPEAQAHAELQAPASEPNYHKPSYSYPRAPSQSGKMDLRFHSQRSNNNNNRIREDQIEVNSNYGYGS